MNEIAVIIVTRNKQLIVIAPFFNITGGLSTLSADPPIKKLIMNEGIIKFTNEGKNNFKNWKNSTYPACQTIKVVISPKGLKAPPAFAATTIFTQLILVKFLLPLPTAKTTAHIVKAVVKLSAIGDKKNDIKPVIQNNFL